jgi:hypothetical protein
MRRAVKITLMVLAVPVAILAYFAPNIHGYYRFKQVCESEGGLRIHHKLQRGVPWQSNFFGGYSVSSHGVVPFVRLVWFNRQLQDVRYRSGPAGDDRSYDAAPADLSVSPSYEVRLVTEMLPGELRLSRSGYEVREIATGRLMVRWYQFSYGRFDQGRTLLAAPSGIDCHRTYAFFEAGNFKTYFDD